MSGTPIGAVPPFYRYDQPLGAHYRADGTTACSIWAPSATTIDLMVEGSARAPIALQRDEWGYFSAVVPDLPPGTRYRYRIDGEKLRPDPFAFAQPEGVHGPSEVVDPHFAWSDQGWFGRPLREYVLYELHVGTFTPEGTFEAIIPHLPRLRDLGITALELLPVAHFPGERNWGYDGVYLFAPHSAYGGVLGLKRLVDACHAHGMAVVLDVVYNHFGPEGNYLWDYARPFFTDRYRTPWGDAINYDGPQSDGVRHAIISNARYWLETFHIDALRLDAVHAIYDFSAYHILAELADETARFANTANRRAYLIAESDLNDSRLIRTRAEGGYALDSQWVDDFHHALHVLLTGEQNGYYADFGRVSDLARSLRQGYVHSGEYAPHRGRRHGNSPLGLPGERFCVCTQNHDQVGNRALGDRLSASLNQHQLQLAAAVLCLSPFLPMLFMGEEYGERAPFQYFTDHGDPALIEGVREGRKREFAAFVPLGEAVPDPQDPATFARSKLNHALAEQGEHAALWEFYRELLRLRRELPALAELNPAQSDVTCDEAAKTITMLRHARGQRAVVVLNFAAQAAEIPLPTGVWRSLISTDRPLERASGTISLAAQRVALLIEEHNAS